MRLALWDDTVVLSTTDDGHDLCERGVYGKRYHNYDSHALIPLLLWHPGLPGPGSIDAITTTVDLFATVLDIAGLPVPEGTHGHSVLPLLTGDRGNARDGILYGLFGEGLCYTDAEWTSRTSFIAPPIRTSSTTCGTNVPTTSSGCCSTNGSDSSRAVRAPRSRRHPRKALGSQQWPAMRISQPVVGRLVE
jgi:N-sulfoglucosamine sulfohydrolase-like protein